MRPNILVHLLVLLASALATAETLVVRPEVNELVAGSQPPGLTLEIANVPPGAKLHGLATLGQLEGVSHGDGATRHVRWLPPPGRRAPANVHVAFWIDGPGIPEVASAQFSLLGRTDLEIRTEPNALVRVQVGRKTFGPRTASAAGVVTVPIDVPPDVRQARVLAQTSGQQSSRTLPLEVPIQRHASIAPAVEGNAPRSRSYAIVVQSGATPASPLELKARAGGISPLSTTRPWTILHLEANPQVSELAVSARFSGESEDAAALVIPLEPLPAVPLREEPRGILDKGFIGVSGGYFTAGGANAGGVVDVRGGYRLPWLQRRMTVNAFAGLRVVGLNEVPAGLSAFDSRILAFPLGVGMGVHVWRAGPLGVDARAGVAGVPFSHRVSAAFLPTFTESGIGWEGQLAVEASWRIHAVEPFAELSAGLGQTRTPRLQARLGGIGFALGVRYIFGDAQVKP